MGRDRGLEGERALLAAARAGDVEAFQQLVERYQQRVFALACRMTGDRAAAEDLTQETFVKAFQGLAQFEERSAFYTWVYRIAVNLCLRHVQRQRTMSFEDWPPVPSGQRDDEPALDPEQAVLREEVKVGCLTGLVRCLPFEQRAAFVLATLLDVPDRDVAAILDCSVGAVKARLTRARDSLCRFLERRCQWIDERNHCRCHRYIAHALAKGLISGQELAPDGAADARQTLQDLDRIRDVMALYRGLPQPRRSDDLIARIRRGLADREWKILG